MALVVLYDAAVQDARNRLRSAQIAAMTDVLDTFVTSLPQQDKYAAKFVSWVNSLKPLQAASPSVAGLCSKANARLLAAQTRAGDLYQNGKILDVFAFGDVFRYLGEFIEFGSQAGDANLKGLDQFRKGLRNQLAFNKAINRARLPVPGFEFTGKPDLGIFKLSLLDRSLVKFMERYYGPYVGADISGTTTDALDVLAWYVTSARGTGPTDENLAKAATYSIDIGAELVPIATMVLQYHHSLTECGLALALPSTSMAETADKAGLKSFDPYDFGTLINQSPDWKISAEVAARANAILKRDLGGARLVILRDWMDVEAMPPSDRSAYGEIALLGTADAFSALNQLEGQIFDLKQQYPEFSSVRDMEYYAKRSRQDPDANPALAAMAQKQFGNAELLLGTDASGTTVKRRLAELTSMRGDQIDALSSGMGAASLLFDDFNKALAKIDPTGHALAAPPELFADEAAATHAVLTADGPPASPGEQQAVTSPKSSARAAPQPEKAAEAVSAGKAPTPLKTDADGEGEAQAKPAEDAAQKAGSTSQTAPPRSQADILKSLDPTAIDALQKLLAAART